MIKKAGEFAGKSASGELFVRISEQGSRKGKAVLTFPGETQPIAFDVRSDPALKNDWHLSFEQPDRFVRYERRVNVWRGGTLAVDFTRKNGRWSGELLYNGIDVGTFSLTKI